MKMETPKMDVVRFNEADVIVASGEEHRRFATLAGWANNTPNDATLTFSNGDTISYNYAQIKDMTEHDLGGLTFTNDYGSVTIEQLAADEDSYGDWNGTYVRTGKGKYDWYAGQ